MKKLIIDYTPFCTRAALVEDGEMIDFSVERSSGKGLVGNIYKGKVENVIGGMQACFVNIGQERNGFLYTGDGENGAKVPGRHRAVRSKGCETDHRNHASGVLRRAYASVGFHRHFKKNRRPEKACVS